MGQDFFDGGRTYEVPEWKAEMDDFLGSLSRDQLIELCVWNDPNGCYRDEESIAELGEVASEDTLREIVRGWVEDDEVAAPDTLALFKRHV